MSRPWTAAVLVGGRSERMGVDKASMTFRGEPLLPATVRRLRAGGATVLLVARPGQELAVEGARTVVDAWTGSSMGGVHAAVAAGADVVVGCDQPLLNVELLAWLAGRLANADLVLPSCGGVPQPLHAAYGPGCLPALEAAIRDGALALRRGWFEDLRVDRPAEAEWGTLDDGSSFAGANTPEAWAALEGQQA